MDRTYWSMISQADSWLNENPPSFGDITQWRIGKIIEEVGEVQAALIAVAGANPRKIATPGTMNEVVKELCDVIITACVALKHVHPESPEQALAHRSNVIAQRIKAA